MPLPDSKAVEIISKASRPNVAKPRTTDKDFRHIFKDFFGQWQGCKGFSSQRVVDLGPGQFDFARIIRDGGGECENIDNDPAVIELGEYLGFGCLTIDMKQMDASALRGRYDGVFCKFSINALWDPNPAAQRRLITQIDALLQPDGWGWIAPWNGRSIPELLDDDETVQTLLQTQRETFADHGWRVYDLTRDRAAYYGITGRVENNPLFLKNLDAPKGLG